MWRSTLFCLCAVVFAAWADKITPVSRVINLKQGPVRGYKDPIGGIYSFQSIPYATVPTGANRFKAPLPPPTWKEPIEAVSKRIACPQVAASMLPDMNQQEDCLIASVYVPLTEEKNLTVVVYVHGGAFQGGFGDLFIPTKLVAEHNIIAVTFNYRVGTHGFLCLGTEDVPGNAGMKDMVAALRWVKKNIAEFGGDPEQVTVAGYSAGSAAVDLLILSESTEGLFNKAIPESGAAIAQWTIQSDPLENAKSFAKNLNFTNVDDIYALEDFYKTASFELLNSIAYFENTDSTFGPSPCIERATSEEVFLDRSPIDILKSEEYRKVPMLYGFANMEGLMRVDLFESWKNKMNEKFSDFLPADLEFESVEQREKEAKEVKEFYFGNKPVSNDNILRYIDFFTDVLFAYPMLRSVKYQVAAGHNQIYLYQYSFVDENTPNVPHTNVKGAKHCAQTYAVFYDVPGFMETNKTLKFIKMSGMMREIWATFIKTGIPWFRYSLLPPWKSVWRSWTPYMELDNDNDSSMANTALLEDRTRFWDDIYLRHYRNPIPPPPPPTPTRIEL